MKNNELIFGKNLVRKGVKNKDFEGKKGIVFIKNEWGPTDHIDVWNGAMMKGG